MLFSTLFAQREDDFVLESSNISYDKPRANQSPSSNNNKKKEKRKAGEEVSARRFTHRQTDGESALSLSLSIFILLQRTQHINV